VTVVDANGAAVPDAEPMVHLSLAGDATIAGVDNGDQVSHARFQSDSVKLFAGKALVIVRAGRREGPVVLTAKSDALGPGSTRITLSPTR
jgi:beta-galactosidase